ncbi:MAG: hypothetical protein WCN92_07170 [Eubacteriales bacterium]
MKRAAAFIITVCMAITMLVPCNSAYIVPLAAKVAAQTSVEQVVPPDIFTPLSPPVLAAGVPQRLPQTLGNMTMNNLFYKPKQHTGAIDCLDLRSLDWYTRIAAYCLQGLVARNKDASIFIISCGSDIEWKNYLSSAYGVEFHELTANELFEKYALFVKKMFVYNWDSGGGDPYQMVMAVNMASVSDGLPVSNELASLLTGECGYPINMVKEDLTARWNNKLEAYEWGIQNILPLCNKNYVGACDGGDSIWDYLYATQSFSFWLDYTVSEEKALIDKILTAEGYTMPGVVLGYGPTGDALLHATGPKGFGYLVSDYFVNATFLASFPLTDKTYHQKPIDIGLKGKNGVMYVSVYISDGDNIQFNQKASQGMWSNTTDRGKYPVALEINPALLEIAPPMLEWFESRRTNNDELMGGPAGFSYIWEDEFKNDTQTWDNWHAINNYFLNRADMRTVASSRVTNSNAQNSFMQKSAIIGALEWGDPYEFWRIFNGKVYNYGDKPVVVAASCGNAIFNKFKNVYSNPFKPTFYALNVTQGDVCSPLGDSNAYKYINSEMEKLKSKYGDKIEFVLPSDMLTMAKNYSDTKVVKNTVLHWLKDFVNIISKLFSF